MLFLVLSVLGIVAKYNVREKDVHSHSRRPDHRHHMVDIIINPPCAQNDIL